MNNPDQIQYELVPDSECDDQEDYPDEEQMRRDIAVAMQEIKASARGKCKLRTSELVNGEWSDREETGPEFEARRAVEREADAFKREVMQMAADIVEHAAREVPYTGEFREGYRRAQVELADMLRKVASGEITQEEAKRRFGLPPHSSVT